MCRITRLCVSFLLLIPLSACEGPPSAKKVVSEGKASEAEKAEKPGTILSQDDAAAKPMPGGISMPPVAGPGLQLRDPSWFKPTIFAGATVVSKGHAAADENGLFASEITLRLAEGTDIDTCVQHLLDTVSADVPGLEVVDKGDRRSITGSTSTYSVVLLCGEAKGRMTAYLSYNWTSLPPA